MCFRIWTNLDTISHISTFLFCHIFARDVSNVNSIRFGYVISHKLTHFYWILKNQRSKNAIKNSGYQNKLLVSKLWLSIVRLLVNKCYINNYPLIYTVVFSVYIKKYMPYFNYRVPNDCCFKYLIFLLFATFDNLKIIWELAGFIKWTVKRLFGHNVVFYSRKLHSSLFFGLFIRMLQMFEKLSVLWH